MTGDEQAAAMIPVACGLVCAVRDQDHPAIAGLLDSLSPQDFYALAVVMAAMIPDDTPLPELLGWLEQGSPQREAMLAKAHHRAGLRQKRGLLLWGPLAALEAEWQANRKAAGRRDSASRPGSLPDLPDLREQAAAEYPELRDGERDAA